MIGFVFGITLVFGFIEEIGYMARISYVFDNTMAKLGLQGKAIMPFPVSFGCTIGGAAGARVIDSWGQRILTIALAWAVPCSATWAIVPMISSVFFGAGAPLVIVAVFAVILMVRSVDVARHLGVSKPSVSHAVATLRDGGFLIVDEDYHLHLTDVGREVAERIYEKHRSGSSWHQDGHWQNGVEYLHH